MHRIKFTKGQIDLIRSMYEIDRFSVNAIADKFGVSYATMYFRMKDWGIVIRRRWAKKWRRCSGCEKHFEVNKENFYGKKDYLCKACKRKYRNRNSFQDKGITEREYNQMLKKQDGVCAICHNTETAKNGKRLSIDHNHKTGEIRGLLCSMCNAALGLFRDDHEIISEAVSYLSH